MLNKIFGYLPGRIASFVMNLHTCPKEIYLSRCPPPPAPTRRADLTARCVAGRAGGGGG